MPIPLVKKYGKRGEELWKKAKESAKKQSKLPDGTQIPDNEDNWSDKVWAYVVGIFQKMVGESIQYRHAKLFKILSEN